MSENGRDMAKRPSNPADLMDYLLERDPRLHWLSSELHRRQKLLKKAVGPESYRLYLLVEDTANELCAELITRVWTIGRSLGRRERSHRSIG